MCQCHNKQLGSALLQGHANHVLHVRDHVFSACKGYSLVLLCRACTGILYTVTYAFDSRVMQQHKHAQDASMPSQTDVLDADEEHLLVM